MQKWQGRQWEAIHCLVKGALYAEVWTWEIIQSGLGLERPHIKGMPYLKWTSGYLALPRAPRRFVA